MAASCQKIQSLIKPARANQGLRAFVFLTLSCILPALPSYAATGDAKIVYGESGTGILRTRDYTNSTSSWSAEGNSSTTATVVRYVVTKASPQSDEYVTAAAINPSGSTMTLYVTRWDGSVWNLDVNGDTSLLDLATVRAFDVAYEQNTGNWLVVYSNGATTNELSYYYRSCNVNGGNGTCTLIGPCTKESNRTTAAVEWVRMDSRPSSDEIAVAFSDANDDLSALIWKPTNEYAADCAATSGFWTDEPAAALETTLPTTNYYKFDVAYEQTSGDALIAWYLNATADLKYSTHAAAGGAWAAASTNTTFANLGVDVDLCPEPGSNQIGIASLTASTTSADTETGIWAGTAWGNIRTDLDAVAESNTSMRGIGCGWIGTSGTLIAVYNDEQTTGDIDWQKWTSAGGWVTGTDASYSAGTEQERNISVYNFPGENKIMVAFATSLSDLWTAKFDGTTWTFLNSGAALELTMSDTTTLNSGAQGVAITAFSVTPVAEILTLSAQKDADQVKLSWNTKTESRVGGYHIARAEKKPGEENALQFERINEKLIPSAGGPMAGSRYSFVDQKADPAKDYVYKVEVIGKGGNVVTQTTLPITPDSGGRATYMDAVTGKTDVVSIDKPMEAPTRLTRTGEKVQLTTGVDYAFTEMPTKPALPKAQALAQQPVFGSGATAALAAKAKKAQAPSSAQISNVPQIAQLKEILTAAVVKTTDMPAMKLHVKEPGICRVSGASLAQAGWDLSKVKPEKLQLASTEKAVPVRLIGMADGKFDADDAIEFWGQPQETRFYNENIYWLSQSKAGGALMSVRPDDRSNGSSILSAEAVIRKEGNQAYYSESPTDAHWFFEHEMFSGEALDIVLAADAPAFTEDKAKLVIGMQGMSSSGYGDVLHNRQHIAVYLNNEPLGEYAWDHDTYAKAAFDVPMNLLVQGDNTVRIEALDEGGSLEQYFLVDYAQLAYPRKLISHADGLVFPGKPSGSNSLYKIHQFPASEALVYALRRNGNVEFLTGASVEKEKDGYQVVVSDKPERRRAHRLAGLDPNADGDIEEMLPSRGFRPHLLPQGQDRFAVMPPQAVKDVASIELDEPSDWRTRQVKPYLILAPKAFHAALADFAAHRNGMLVDVQDIYDEYAGGLPDPAAIRDFLVSAAARGTKMALLAGDGHYDYRDFQKSGVAEYVPPAIVQYRWGEVVADSWFATPKGEMVPVLAIGRWPVHDVNELAAVIAKTLAYEQRGSLPGSVFMADDEPVFRATLDKLTQLMPDAGKVTRINYGDYDSIDSKRLFIQAINEGKGLAAYDGHGGVQLWSSARLFTNQDVGLLTNANKYPVLLALGCLSGYFATPTGMDSLAEVLLLAPNKGVAAAISPTGLTSTVEQQVLAEAWLKALRDKHASLGEALLQAQQAVAEQVPPDNARAVIQTFSLLGDPALKLDIQ